MLEDQHRNNKWEPKYVGPYRIVKRTPKGNFVLIDTMGKTLGRNIPPEKLKFVASNPVLSCDETDIYEVEQILQHRGSPGRYYYLTKWKNHPKSTLEPESHFMDTKIINDYWKSSMVN